MLELVDEKLASTIGPQGLKVISSIARSLPQVPGMVLALLIFKTISLTPAGVLKSKLYWFHWGLVVVGISPVLWLANTTPVVVSMVKAILGSLGEPLHWSGFMRFTIHAP